MKKNLRLGKQLYHSLSSKNCEVLLWDTTYKYLYSVLWDLLWHSLLCQLHIQHSILPIVLNESLKEVFK